MSGFVGWMTIRPMWWLSGSPIAVQLLPPSIDLYTPSPHETLLRGFASPVPTQTMSGFEGATATAPRETVACLSNTHSQVVPLLTVFHNPPDALATYMVLGRRSTTATSVMRPLMLAGPIERGASAFNKRASKTEGSAARRSDASEPSKRTMTTREGTA